MSFVELFGKFCIGSMEDSQRDVSLLLFEVIKRPMKFSPDMVFWNIVLYGRQLFESDRIRS